MEDADTDSMSLDAEYVYVSDQRLDGRLVREARMHELEGFARDVDKSECFGKTGTPPIRG